MAALVTVLVVLVPLILFGLALSVRIVKQYEKGVLFRLGRVIGVRAIRQFLTDPDARDGAPWPTARARTWSSPAKGCWISGTSNQAGHSQYMPSSWPGAPTPPRRPVALPDPTDSRPTQPDPNRAPAPQRAA
jgi:hypothetical protein